MNLRRKPNSEAKLTFEKALALLEYVCVLANSVLSKNPDVIFIATMGGFGEQEKKVWENYKGLKAAETKKVFLIDSETSCSPTPDNFAKAFADVVKSLNR